MPYQSDKQRRFMHAQHPGIASRWDEEIRQSRKKKSVSKAESMQRVGKRRDWETIDDMQHRERQGRQKKRTGRQITGAGVGVASLAIRSSAGTKPGLPQEIRNVSTGFRSVGSQGLGVGARNLGQTMVKNPYGAATVIGAATVATGLGVRGIGARQARSARNDMRDRRKELAQQRSRRSQDVLVVRKSADLYPRFGAGGAVGRRITDPYESLGLVEKGVGAKVGAAALVGGAAYSATPHAKGVRRKAKVGGVLGRDPRFRALPRDERKAIIDSAVGKADRRFDPEVRRQHNKGAVTGAAGVGAGVMSASAYRDLKRSNSIAEGKRGVFVTARSGAKVAGAAGLGLVASRNYRKANSQRNRRYS